ncbi:poly [ADP-ribose] polymerase tankyrase-2 isoform X2 [Nilaparvata lugens]|uniref:poly [ADP-ribose] polymerase tankyrase-2 isoform X2 n=1 Tax=Nilaparvata lugens TaxID=108931 RepID=UPI00193E2600|nr:poly [ADP-ribose] polymerase tankyrase-2 isoform X2 [Nilaparvata lugens]
MELDNESCTEVAKFLREIITRLEEEEKIHSKPMILSTPFVYYPPPDPGKIKFFASKRRYSHAPSLNSPYADPMFKNMFQSSKIRDDRIALRGCVARSYRLNKEPQMTFTIGPKSHFCRKWSEKKFDHFSDQKEFLLSLFFNNTERAEFLMNRGQVNINGSEWSEFSRPLHMAAEFGFVDLVKLLLKNGADPNIVNQLDQTPLQVAARRNQLEVVKILLEAGADPNCRNEQGQTASQMAGASIGPGDVVFNELKRRVTTQVINILTRYARQNKQSSDEEELLLMFKTSLCLTENKEQLKDQLTCMVDELSSLSLSPDTEESKPTTSRATN